MTRMLNEGKGYIIYLDNLFTSLKLLSTLRDYGIGRAGTVRTSKTKREENKEKQDLKADEGADLCQDIYKVLPRDYTTKKVEKEKNFGINKMLIELKTNWLNHIA